MTDFTLEQRKAIAIAEATAKARARSTQQPDTIEGQEEPLQNTDFSTKEMISNIPGSALKLGKDLATPILHPVDTAKGVYNLLKGVAQKAIPGDQEEEKYADAVGEFITDRYGSWDNTKKTIEQDPVGFLSDVSALLTLGGTIVPKIGKVGKVASTVQKIGKAIDPLNIAVNSSMYVGGKIIPKATAAKMYESAAKFSTKLSPAERSKLSATALKEGVMPTSQGMAIVDTKIGALGDKIDGLIKVADDTGVTIPKSRIYQHLNELRKEVGGAKINAPKDLRAINHVVRTFDTHMKNIGKTSLTPSELQAFKQDAYTRIKWDSKAGQANYIKEQASKAMARAAREQLEKVSPDIAALNKRQGDLLELMGPLKQSAGRIENRDILGIGMPLKATAGGVVGGPTGAALGTATAILDIPQVKAKTALLIDALKNRGVNQFTNNSTLPLMLRQSQMLAGRLSNQENDGIPMMLRSPSARN